MMDLEKLKQSKTTEELLEFGIINMDKSTGPTSFNISQFVKRKLNLRKTSHLGTLDPKVTGVLPITLSRACKISGYLIGHDKTYVGIMRFHEDIPKKKVEAMIKKKFLGEITQLPPVKSRVKRAERQRTIHTFKILEKDKTDFLIETKVQGGTYIRKLIHDLGEELKTGAHMLELRRTQAGIFDESTITKLYDFEKAVDEYNKGNDKALREMITPAEIITEFYPIVEIKESEVEKLWDGKPFLYEYLTKKTKLNKEDKICVFSKTKMIGVYKVTNEKEIFARPEFVMQPIK